MAAINNNNNNNINQEEVIIYNPAEPYHLKPEQLARAWTQVHDNAPNKKIYQYLAAKLLFLASCDAFTDAPFEASAIGGLEPRCQYVYFPQPIQLDDGSGSSMSTRITTTPEYDQFLVNLGVVRIFICMCSTGDVASKMFRILLLKDPTGKQPSGCNMLFEGAVWKMSKSSIDNLSSSSSSLADLRSPLPPMTPTASPSLRSSAGASSINKARVPTSQSAKHRQNAYLTSWEMDRDQPVCLVHSLNAIYTYYALIGHGMPLSTVVANIETNGNVAGGGGGGGMSFDGGMNGQDDIGGGGGGDNGGSSKNVSRKKSSLILVKNKAALLDGMTFNIRPLVVSMFLLQKAPDDENSDQWVHLFNFELKKINPGDTSNSNAAGKVNLFQSSPYIRQMLYEINKAQKPRGRGSSTTARQRAASRRRAKSSTGVGGYESDDSCGSVGSPTMYSESGEGDMRGIGSSTFGCYDKVRIIPVENVAGFDSTIAQSSSASSGFGYGYNDGSGVGGAEFPYGFYDGDDGAADFDDAGGGNRGFWDNSDFNQDSNGFLSAAAALFENPGSTNAPTAAATAVPALPLASIEPDFEPSLIDLMSSTDNDINMLWDAIGACGNGSTGSSSISQTESEATVSAAAAAEQQHTEPANKQYVSLYHALDGYLDGLCNAMHKINLQQPVPAPSLNFEKHVDYAIVAADSDSDEDDDEDDGDDDDDDDDSMSDCEETIKEVMKIIAPVLRERQQELEDDEDEDEDEEDAEDEPEPEPEPENKTHTCVFAKENRLHAPSNVFCESLDEDVMRKYIYLPREHSYVLSGLGSGLIDSKIQGLRWVLFDKCLFRQCSELRTHVPDDLQELCDEASAETCFFLLPVVPEKGLIYFHPDFVCRMVDGAAAEQARHDGSIAVVEERVSTHNRELQRAIQLREQQQQHQHQHQQNVSVSVNNNNNNKKRPTNGAAAGNGSEEDGNFIHVFKMTQEMRGFNVVPPPSTTTTMTQAFGAPAAQYTSGAYPLPLPLDQQQQQQQQQPSQQSSIVLEHPNYRLVYPFSQPNALLLRDMSVQTELQQQKEEAMRAQRQEMEEQLRQQREQAQAEQEQHRREMEELKTELRSTVNTLKQFVNYANNLTNSNNSLELIASQSRIASQALSHEVKELRAEIAELLKAHRDLAAQQQQPNAIVNEVLQQLGRREAQNIDKNIASQLHRLNASASTGVSAAAAAAAAAVAVSGARPGSKIAAAAAHLKNGIPTAGYAGPMQSSMSSSMTGSSSSSHK